MSDVSIISNNRRSKYRLPLRLYNNMSLSHNASRKMQLRTQSYRQTLTLLWENMALVTIQVLFWDQDQYPTGAHAEEYLDLFSLSTPVPFKT